MIAEGTSSTSPLEVASWIATIATLALAIIAGLLYQFGRMRPMTCVARYRTGRHQAEGPMVVVDAKARSRTGNDQTIQTMAIVQAPSAWRRFTRPHTPDHDQHATPFDWSTLDDAPAGVVLSGHDSVRLEGHLLRAELPYGEDARLRLKTSRRRPVLVRIRPEI